MRPRLTIVPTPIGNLGDMTFRAIDTLKEVDYILAEDTRHSLKLLTHYHIQKRLVAYHAHNEHQQVVHLLEDMKTNARHLALISDAGTPAISDPGYLLVRACIAQHIPVEVLPGACALVVAAVASGFPTHRFLFLGFLPQQKGRQKALQAIPDEETVILYESPHRLLKLLQEIRLYFGKDKKVAVAKELSKLNETIYRGSVDEVERSLSAGVVKGEFVVVLKAKEAEKNRTQRDETKKA